MLDFIFQARVKDFQWNAESKTVDFHKIIFRYLFAIVQVHRRKRFHWHFYCYSVLKNSRSAIPHPFYETMSLH